MAWNSSPQVRVAHGTAESIARIEGCEVPHMVSSGQLGYASYGTNSERCGHAKRMADACFDHLMQQMPDLIAEHHRRDHRRLDGRNIDWDQVRRDINLRLDLLRSSINADMDPNVRHMYVRDVVLPVITLLSRFVASVHIETEEASS